MRRRLICLALLALATSSLGCGRVGKGGVAASIEQLASISAEGALMADDVARGRSKTTFVRVHGSELSAQAEHEAEKLNDDPVSQRLRRPVQSAIELSQDIGGAIDELRVSPGDRGQAGEDEARLHRWAGEARKLAETL